MASWAGIAVVGGLLIIRGACAAPTDTALATGSKRAMLPNDMKPNIVFGAEYSEGKITFGTICPGEELERIKKTFSEAMRLDNDLIIKKINFRHSGDIYITETQAKLSKCSENVVTAEEMIRDFNALISKGNKEINDCVNNPTLIINPQVQDDIGYTIAQKLDDTRDANCILQVQGKYNSITQEQTHSPQVKSSESTTTEVIKQQPLVDNDNYKDGGVLSEESPPVQALPESPKEIDNFTKLTVSGAASVLILLGVAAGAYKYKEHKKHVADQAGGQSLENSAPSMPESEELMSSSNATTAV